MAKKKAKPLTDSRRYETFVKQRDLALEAILRKYLRALDRVVDYLKDHTEEIVARTHIADAELHTMKRSMTALENRLDHLFSQSEQDLVVLLTRMRGTIYGLSTYGQSEAILRALGTQTRVDLSHPVISEQLSEPMRAGGTIHQRVWMSLERLKRKIVDAYQTGILFDDTSKDIIERVLSVFPRARITKRGPKPLKHPKLTESDDGDRGATAFGMSAKKPEVYGEIDPDLWDQMVDDYIQTEIPFYPGRQPKSEETYYEEHGQYEWELERDTTQDFVDQVRAGEIDSANENGITDFLWLAVLDDRTDECCSSRDGLTTTEIEEGLASGAVDDDCDATVPPAHFNCRCVPAPMSDDIPDESPPDWGSFDNWLNSKEGT